jgi:hypothetical protein
LRRKGCPGELTIKFILEPILKINSGSFPFTTPFSSVPIKM